MNATRLILASTSPYRRALLGRLRLAFEIRSPAIDESRLPGEAPVAVALRLAAAKASAIAIDCPDALVIGCDQVAVLDGECLGKPGTHERAVAQLKAMSGREVVFHTAVALLNTATGALQVENVPSTVGFRRIADIEIERYLVVEQPFDCAGSAKIEALGIALVEYVRSDDPSALIGLPLIRLTSMLRQEAVAVLR